MDEIATNVTINGTTLTLHRSDVMRAVAADGFGPVRHHAVEVNGQLYPVKEVLSRITKLDVLDFNTVQARGVLRRLGFTLRTVP